MLQLKYQLLKALTFTIMICTATHLEAQQSADFRLETDLMEAGKAKPIDQTVTLFANGIAYDYSRETPHRVMVVDASNNRITFLDSQRQIQTRVNLNELQSGIESAKNRLMQVPGGPEKLEDAAKLSVDPSSGVITVGQKFIRYEATAESPSSPQFADQYAVFANVSSLVNAWQSHGTSPPPFARMQLNQTLGDRKAIPTTITRTVFAGSRESKVISRIHPSYSLTAEDKQRVDQFGAMILSYPTKSLAEYNNPASPVTR